MLSLPPATPPLIFVFPNEFCVKLFYSFLSFRTSIFLTLISEELCEGCCDDFTCAEAEVSNETVVVDSPFWYKLGIFFVVARVATPA